ncbi:hypothetical protein NA56DRAFT_300127 [Hyaloscypha hepaticicola]|uniref:Uncharacterized protein n=1 Tax=Hyaloscypha hepaticicola TaxID=2082293 RepID=A0A2J6QKW0_9HELO|nr:hypothetical protein NA56DRAFT_300127 [Hyaloscypha hepaticicola]
MISLFWLLALQMIETGDTAPPFLSPMTLWTFPSPDPAALTYWVSTPTELLRACVVLTKHLISYLSSSQSHIMDFADLGLGGHNLFVHLQTSHGRRYDVLWVGLTLLSALPRASSGELPIKTDEPFYISCSMSSNS